MMQVLKSRQQIDIARREFQSQKLTRIASPLERFAKKTIRRMGVIPAPSLGDYIKSWDVLRTVRFIEQNVPKAAPVLDIGCYASETIVALHALGFRDLHGVDLNPALKKMPHADAIDYRVADFMHSGFPDRSFRAITSISVIEHGLNAPKLFAEMARMLLPGGYFVASFDYWPEKIDTSKTRMFGLDWTIFSREDVSGLLTEAARHDLRPMGSLDYSAQERAISHAGYEYTFAWMVLEKSA